MKGILALGLIALLALPLQAQTVADSLDVEIVAFPTILTLEGPSRVSAGSQVVYQISLDPPGTSAQIIWSLTDPVTAEPVDSVVAFFVEASDSTATVQIGDEPGSFEVKAEAVPLDSILIGALEGDSVNLSGSFTMAVGESRQLCAWGFSGEVALWVTPGPPCHPSAGVSWPSETGTGIYQRISFVGGMSVEGEDGPSGFEGLMRRLAENAPDHLKLRG